MISKGFSRGAGASEFRAGAAGGIPIALGYFAVSFSFGIVARASGIGTFASSVLSAVNVTSAGQFAALGIIAADSGLLLMALTELVINLRYALMSASLSQKIAPDTSTAARLIMAFGVTDEIFGISALRPGRLDPRFSFGAMAVAIPAWVAGTACGAAAGGILPGRALSALGVALFGMFIAIVVPPAKSDRATAAVVLASMALAYAASCLPFTANLPESARVIAITLIAAGTAAFLAPPGDDKDGTEAAE